MADAQNTTVDGPIAGGTRGWPFGASMTDLASQGYCEEEYILAGSAVRYRPVSGTELGPDGRWQAEVAGNAEFRTRMLIYRPIDPTSFNGTVILTWNNVTAGHDLFGAESPEIFEGGFALACLTTQKVGIVGLPPENQGLANWDPERYGSLSIPSDDYSFDIFTQAAVVIGPGRDTRGNDPMGGLDVQHVVGQGASQSAGRLATYVNAIAPLNDAFSGFILTIYFGRGTPLEVGDTIVNINAPQTQPAQRRLQGVNLLRDDLTVPVFVVNSELEAIACYSVRQPDTDLMRFWESAGTCHVSQQGRAARQRLIDRDGIVSRPAEPGINAIPMNPIYDASYHYMHRWLAAGTPPPVMPRVDFSGDPAEIVRDEHGIAVGGIRLPQADVPLAENSAVPLSSDISGVLGGSSHTFTRDKILALYGDRDTYMKQFAEAGQRAVDNGAIMPRELPKLEDEAGATWSRLVD